MENVVISSLAQLIAFIGTGYKFVTVTKNVNCGKYAKKAHRGILGKITEFATYQNLGLGFEYSSAINGRLAKAGKDANFQALAQKDGSQPLNGCKFILQNQKGKLFLWVNSQNNLKTEKVYIGAGLVYGSKKAIISDLGLLEAE